MIVLIVLFGALLIYRGLGAAGVPAFGTWIGAGRWAISTMFAFTAVSHFAPMRRDLVAMVPRSFPNPSVIVGVTGVLEIAGVVGLLIPATRWWSAWGLIALLVAMFPANVNAAMHGIKLRGRAAMPLWARLPMQALFIAWIWWVGVRPA